MNVFVTVFFVDILVAHVQLFSMEFYFFLLEEISMNVWLLQYSVRSTFASDQHLHEMSKFIQNLSSQ